MDVLNDDRNSKSMLTQFFAINYRDLQARNHLYREIPEHYFWHKGNKEWHQRRLNKKVVGRIYTVSPSKEEKFYLCVLLSHLRDPASWEYLLSPGETCLPTFKKTVKHWSFLESDNSLRECLVEV